MDADEPAPIEVELAAHEPPSGDRRRRRRERERAESSSPGPDDERERAVPPPTDRTRLMQVAALSAILALVLGWMLGRTSGDTDPVAEPPVTTRATTTTSLEPSATLPIVGDEIDGADFGESPGERPTLPPRTGGAPTTTGVLGPTTQAIGVDERLAGVPLRLVGVELGGVLVEADLTAGTLTDFGADRLVSDGRALIAGPDWVVAGAAGASRVIRSDGSEAPLDLGDRWQHLHVPGTELFWRLATGSPLSSSVSPSGDDTDASLVGLDGEPVGPTIELPVTTWPAGVDPASGGLVVASGPRNYVIGPDRVEYLGIGELVALDERLAIGYDCDETLVCGLRRIDRATGDVTVVPSDPQLDDTYRWHTTQGWGGASTTSLSPDERWVAVIGSSWRTSAGGLVNLESGAFVELARDSFPFEVVWSPDGRWAIALVDREVIAYDTVTGDRFPVFTDQVQWIQLTARPPAP